jgi:hypothetical protein
VTKQFFIDGSSSPPYITIVAAPTLAPLGQFSTQNPLGFNIDDYWDESVLEPYTIQLGEGLHCPMLAASEGFSRVIKLPGSSDYLTDAQPLFFPLGEHIECPVTTPTGFIQHAFFLPEVCNMPLGMAWPTTISYEDFHSSIQCLKGGYLLFLRVLQALQPTLRSWFVAVQLSPVSFISPSFPFMDIHPAGFPTLNTGDYPGSVVDPRAFSPLVEMLNGFIWRLTCDSVLATGSPEARKAFQTFLT